MARGSDIGIGLIGIFGLALSGSPLGARSVSGPVITPSDDGSGYSVTIWPPNRQFRQVRLSDCVDVFDQSGNSTEGLCRIQVPRTPGLPAIDSGTQECVGPGC